MPFDAEGWLRENPPPGRNGQVPNRGNPGNLAGGTVGGRPDPPAAGLVVPGRRAAPRAGPQGGATQERRERRGRKSKYSTYEEVVADRDFVKRRARSYIQPFAPAISETYNSDDRKGHDQTIYSSCRLTIDFTLDFTEAWPILCDWNLSHCQPPWTDAELRHKLEDAVKKAIGHPDFGKALKEIWEKKDFGGEKKPPKPEVKVEITREQRDEIERKVAEFLKDRDFANILADGEFLGLFAKLSVVDFESSEIIKVRLRIRVKGWREKIFAEFLDIKKKSLGIGDDDDGDDGDDGDAGGPGDEGGEPDGRPEIVVTTQEYDVTNQAVSALSLCPNVFKRSSILVTVVREDEKKKKVGINKLVHRRCGTPKISILSAARVRDLMTEWAHWVKPMPDPENPGEFVMRSVHPPHWAAGSIVARGQWDEVSDLEAIVETPVLRPDGTIIDKPGYDEATGIIFEPNGEFPAIPDEPTQANARESVFDLLDLVSDFPFSTIPHSIAWLAGALTPFARFAINGCCPLFLFDANMPGIGKSLLCDIISVMVTGRGASRTIFSDSDDEMRKRITSIALASDRMVLIDNIETGKAFGGSAMDSVLTAPFWKDRILGRSEMTAEIPMSTIWYATGNNVTLKGDIIRRVIFCKMVTDEENPEKRSDFKYNNITSYVENNRGKYVSDCLTILRAYFVAGRPKVCEVPLGSFESWSDVVRSAVKWATGHDPCSTQIGLKMEDQNTAARMALVNAWAEMPEQGRGFTSTEIIERINGNPSGYKRMRALLVSWSRNDELPSSRVVGSRLRNMKDQVTEGKYLHCDYLRGFAYWSVKDASEFGGTVDTEALERDLDEEELAPKSPYAPY